MPAAKPSKSSIQNVIDAMITAGLEVGEIHVDASGGFTVTQRHAALKQNAFVDSQVQDGTKVPRMFGAMRQQS